MSLEGRLMNLFSKESLLGNGMALFVALLVFGILYFLKPSYPFQPYGIILPLVPKLPAATAMPVEIYQVAPSHYEPLAKIHVQGHTLNPTQQQEGQIVSYAQKLSQTAGADGLIITGFGFEGSSSNTPAPLAKIVLYGTAIKIN